jgi:hypothetical protein
VATRSLGTLTLDLIAKIGGFEAGLGKAEKEAQKRAKAIEKVFDQAGTAAGVAFGTAVTAALAGAVVFDRLIKQVGDFQDIAEKTGGSAEGFASFAVAAATAGTEINTVAAASIKLTKSLVGVDDESKAAGAALTALGISVSDFKQLAPEDQLENVAKALAGFEDGAQKTAVAMALFGKAGADLLPFLKELEQSGGRQVILTAEQIKQADEYADSQARATAQLKQYAQSVAVQMLPALTVFTDAVKDVVKELYDLGDASKSLTGENPIEMFAQDSAIALAKIVDGVMNAVKAFKALYSSANVLSKLTPQAVVAGLATGPATYAESVKKSIQEASKDIDGLSVGFGFADRVKQGFEKSAKDKTFSKYIKEEAKRLEDAFGAGLDGAKPILNFEGKVGKEKKTSGAKQSEADRYLESLQKQLLKTEELSVAETVLADIASGRLGTVTQEQQASILATAKQIDAARALEIAIKDRRSAVVAEGEAVEKVNEAYQSRLKTLIDATPSAILEKQRSDVKLLTDEFEAGRLSEEAYLEAVTARLDLTADKLKETKDFAKEFGLTFSSAFEDAIVGGKELSAVLQGLVSDIAKIVVRKTITEPIGNAISGAFSSGSGGFFSGIASMFGLGARAAGGPVSGGSPYLVGEKGPEIVVPGRSGTVIPNNMLSNSGGVNVTLSPTINIDSRSDMNQVQALVGRAMRASQAQLIDQLQTAGRL